MYEQFCKVYINSYDFKLLSSIIFMTLMTMFELSEPQMPVKQAFQIHIEIKHKKELFMSSILVVSNHLQFS